MKFNTKTIHGGQKHDLAYGAVMPPIYQTSTYAQTIPGEHKGFEYSRTHNPTRQALENAFASIENGEYGLAFGSGIAAIDAVIKLLRSGDEVISTNDIYGGSYRLFTKSFPSAAVIHTLIPTVGAIMPTRQIKSPTSSPSMNSHIKQAFKANTDTEIMKEVTRNCFSLKMIF